MHSLFCLCNKSPAIADVVGPVVLTPGVVCAGFVGFVNGIGFAKHLAKDVAEFDLAEFVLIAVDRHCFEVVCGLCRWGVPLRCTHHLRIHRCSC